MKELTIFLQSNLAAVLPKERWDDDICDLDNHLTELQRLFDEDLYRVLSYPSLNHLDQYKHLVNSLIKHSKSKIFKQLWKDIVSQQMNKYSRKGILVKDMDCIDVALYVKFLMGKTNNQQMRPGYIGARVFDAKINGPVLLAEKKSFGIDELLANVDENTKFDWNGRLSMQLLNLMYICIAQPKWNALKQGVKDETVAMKNIEYYFLKCDITTYEQVQNELDNFGMTDINDVVKQCAKNVSNALQCQQMLNEEMLIVNLLNLLHNIVDLDEFRGEETHLKVDDEFRYLLEQLDASKYPWKNDDDDDNDNDANDNSLVQTGREAMQSLLRISETSQMSIRPASTRRASVSMVEDFVRSPYGFPSGLEEVATLRDVLNVWDNRERTFLRNVTTTSKSNGEQKENEGESKIVLSKINKKWLELCLLNGNVIGGLFRLFGNDDSFRKHKAMSQYADPMSETRKNTLNQIREYFVDKIVKRIIGDKMTMRQARLFLVNELFRKMKEKHVKLLKEFIDIWDEIRENSDFQQNQYTQDRTLLSKLSSFVLQNCELHVTTTKNTTTTTDSGSKIQYENVNNTEEKPKADADNNAVTTTKQSDIDSENYNDDADGKDVDEDWKDEEKTAIDGKVVKKTGILDEITFGNLVDRLLISTNSDSSGQVFIQMKKSLQEWSTSDVCNLFMRKYTSDSVHGKIVENIFKQRGINGQLLYKYHESQEHMKYLLFSKINRGDASQIGQTFLDFDLTKLSNITMRKSIQYDYSKIVFEIDDGDDASDEQKTEKKETRLDESNNIEQQIKKRKSENEEKRTDTSEEIVNDVLRSAQSLIIQEKMNVLAPKYEIIKKILKIMKEYEIMGGRYEFLNKEIKIEIYPKNPNGDECEKILKEWKAELNDWTKMMDSLRKDYKYLCYYTVNEMRFIYQQWCQFWDSKSCKDECARLLNGKFCAVNTTLACDKTQKFLENNGNFGKNIPRDSDERKWFEELGKFLQLFFDTLGDSNLVKNKHKEKSLPLQHGKPNVFRCTNQDRILENVIKLYSSQECLPQASNILFCTDEMQSEEIVCFLKRSCNSNNILHCLVTPEKLKSNVCDDLLDVLISSIQKNDALFGVIINDRKSKIYAYLSMYDMSISLNLEASIKEHFYQQCIMTDESKDKNDNNQDNNFEMFKRGESNLPFVRVYVSEKACVGKTYEIRKFAQERDITLIHIPCNTFKSDEKFIVDRLCSSHNDDKVIFHLNVSSHCSKDLNVLLFKLLILKYLSCSTNVKNGKSFAVTSNHAFFIELPCELSHEFKQTTLRNVLNHFHFIQDSACIYQKTIRMDINRFKPNAKHLFVLKYLDALKQGKLVIKGKKHKDWDWQKHDKYQFTSQEIQGE